MWYLIRYPLPAKNTLFLSFTEISRRPSHNSLSALSFFLTFAALTARRFLYTTLVIHYCGGHQKVPLRGSRMLKINVFICDILLPRTDASHLPAVKHNRSGGALEPLRSGLVQTGCQKSGKNDSRHLRQCSGGEL